MKIVIYTRVSTEEQKHNFSLKAQKERIEAHCRVMGYNIVAHFEDNHSAKTFNRPEYQKMMVYVEKNKVDKILFTKWDRFSRNITEALIMIDRLKKKKIAVEAVEQLLDLTVPETKALLTLFLVTPEIENDRRALNTSTGMIRAKEEGRWMAGSPFGYRRSKEIKGMLIKNEKAELVLKAFELYATGLYSKEEIRKILMPKGMTLSKAAFWKMFSNIVYTGYINIPAYGHKQEQLVKGLHDAIISIELFELVQSIGDKKKKQKSKPNKANEELPLRGFIVCPKCNGNLTGSASTGNGGRYSYYHCQNGCKRFRADLLHHNFSSWLDSISIKPEIMDLYLEILREIFKKNGIDKDIEIAKLDKLIQEKENLLNRCLDKFLEGHIDKATFDSYNNTTTTNMNKLRKEKQDLQSIDSSVDIYFSYGFFLLANLGHYYNDIDVKAKQKLLGSIFPDKLMISENGYRTIGKNTFIDLLSSIDRPLQKSKNEKASKNADLFRLVAPTRIELVSKV